MVQVRYIDLPTSWKGANLKTDSINECRAVMDGINFLKNSPPEHEELLLVHFRLFVIDTPQKQYKILAAAGISMYTDPAEYSDKVDRQSSNRIKVIAGRPFEQGKATVAVETVLAALAGGRPMQGICEGYGLGLEDVFECLRYAQQMIKNNLQ